MANLLTRIKDIRYRIKNKRRLSEEALEDVYGFSVASKSVSFDNDGQKKRALLNSFLMFCLVYGLALSFIIPFEINANIFFLAIVSALFSLYFGIINCKKWLQSVGYILFFVGFTAFLIIFRSYINSGLNGTLNDFYEIVSDEMDFTRMRTYDETFADQHYMTVTTFFMVIIAAYMMMINFTFNNEQSPLTLLVVIFPFLQMGMYIDKFPGMFVFFLITLSIMVTLMLRYTNQHHVPTKKKKTYYLKRKKNIFQMQISSGRVTWQATAYLFIILLVFCLVTAVLIPESKYIATKDELELKEKTKPAVTQVLMYGLASLFMNGDSAWDDSMGGQLGQVGTVYQDFETDLTVTFTPYVYDTIYIRNKSYSAYWGSEWTQQFIDMDNEYPFTQTITRLYIDSEADNTILQGKMQISIEDYSLYSATLLPYYGSRNNSNITVTSGELNRDITYAVSQDFWNSDYAKAISYDNLNLSQQNTVASALNLYGSISSSELYSENANNLDEVLGNICDEQGFSGTTYEIITQIQEYLKSNFTYTLNPGKLPSGKDFVTYFLTDSKRGYCTYFATAGCLLLRKMGIPSRYVEGYALDMSAVVTADTLTDENYSDWINGESLIGETAVIKASLTDANAHAWCEVYIADYGWVPVEFTVAGTMDESDKSAWSNWFTSLTSSDNDDAGNAIAGLLGADFASVFTWIGKAIIVALIIAIPFIGYRLYTKLKLRKRPDTIIYPSNNTHIMRSYQRLLKRLRRRKILFEENPVPSNVVIKLVEKGMSRQEADELRKLYSKAAYSNSEISNNEIKKWNELIKIARRI